MDKRQNIVELIGALTHLIGNYQDSIVEKLESLGLTMKQFDYIYTIGRLQNPTPSELARELKLSRPAITAIVEHFAEKGYVEKVQSDGDRRMFHIHLTQKGGHVLSTHESIHDTIADAFIQTLSEDELNELTALLGKVAGKLIKE